MSSSRPRRACVERRERERQQRKEDRKSEEKKIIKLYNKLVSPTDDRKEIDKRLQIWAGLIKEKLNYLRSKKVECICTTCEKVLNSEFSLDQLNEFISGAYDGDDVPLIAIDSVMSKLELLKLEGNNISFQEFKLKLEDWSDAIHTAVLALNQADYEVVCSCEDRSTFGTSDLGIDMYSEFSFIIRSLFTFSSVFDEV